MSFLCIDRVPDLVYADVVANEAIRINPANARGGLERGPFEAAGEPTNFWRPGTALRIRFLDGPDDLRAAVLAAAGDWTRHANLSFEVVDDGEADIRITFEGVGNWSALGTMSVVAEIFPPDEPSMCLSEVPRANPTRTNRLARHEFGHAIGLIHEHSSPASGMNWNKPEVYRALGGPPNNWTREQVEYNVFNRYSAETTQFTEFDPASVMLYSFPPSWTLDGATFPENSELSDSDKAFVRRVYPGGG